MAISPDGTQIAYVANRQIFLRALSDTNASSLAGTAESDPAEPVFSPDGKWLAFWSNGQLKKIPVSGGTAVTLASTDNPFGVSWTGDRILLGAGDNAATPVGERVRLASSQCRQTADPPRRWSRSRLMNSFKRRSW